MEIHLDRHDVLEMESLLVGQYTNSYSEDKMTKPKQTLDEITKSHFACIHHACQHCNCNEKRKYLKEAIRKPIDEAIEALEFASCLNMNPTANIYAVNERAKKALTTLRKFMGDE